MSQSDYFENAEPRYLDDVMEEEDEDKEEELSVADFEKELSKYKKIRDRFASQDLAPLPSAPEESFSFSSIFNSLTSGPPSKPKSSTPKPIPSSNTDDLLLEALDDLDLDAPQSTTSSDPNEAFFNSLNVLLRKFYAKNECSKIEEEFKKNYDKWITSLSLDEIERYAKSFQQTSMMSS